MRPEACPALLQAILTVLFQLVVLKICGSTIENFKVLKCKSSWWPEWGFLLYKVGDPIQWM